MISSGDIFRLASISPWIAQCIDSHSEATSLTQKVKPGSRPVMAAPPSMRILTQNDRFSFLICNHSKTWMVLQLLCQLARKVHVTYPGASSWKIDCTKPSTVAFSTLVDASTRIAHHSDSLILSHTCASVSSAISSTHLVTVLAKRGTRATFWTAASPKSSQQMPLAAGRINSSPVVKGFLALAMRSATKNDALSAGTFDDMVIFNNCFCLLSSHVFFLLKNSKGLSVSAGCLVSMWWSSFEAFMASMDSRSPHIIQSGREPRI